MKYKSSIISVLALIAYFSPWWYGAIHTCLGFYILAFLWFLIAWIIFLIQMLKFIKLKKNNDASWKYSLSNSIIILISYVVLFLGWMNNLIVTV
jgi:hypothetical protein